MLDRPSNRLSGGQLQRVAIGRAIVRRPSIFLMDEPLTNLDAKLREQLRVELAVLRRELRIPMIYVTHDQAEALSMGDRIAVLDGGQLRQIGTPEAIYEHPVSHLVARQLGQPAINLVPVHCHDGWWTGAEGLKLIPRTALHPEHTALIGIRSEHITLAGGDDSAQITQIESAGPVVLVSIRWRQQLFQVTASATFSLGRGDTVHPTIDVLRALVWAH